jgi:hypothetical protein
LAKDDLIPFDTLTVDEQKKLASMGGIASGAVRRKKAAMKDVAAMVLGLKRKVSEKTIAQLAEMGIDADEITTQTLALMKLGDKAIAGDIKALEVLRDTAGEKPTDRVDMSHAFIGDFDIILDGEDGD